MATERCFIQQEYGGLIQPEQYLVQEMVRVGEGKVAWRD